MCMDDEDEWMQGEGGRWVVSTDLRDVVKAEHITRWNRCLLDRVEGGPKL